MPETGENVAEAYQISRADQDAFALRSQQKAARAIDRGFFADEIVAVDSKDAKGKPAVFMHDEHPRPQTTAEDLARLKTPFRNPGTVTAGNASGVNDGAAAMIIASEEAAKRNGLKIRGRILGMATAGVAPRRDGRRAGASDGKTSGPPGTQDRRFRRHRAERGLRQPVARRAARAGPSRRRRFREPEWRRHRARPSFGA